MAGQDWKGLLGAALAALLVLGVISAGTGYRRPPVHRVRCLMEIRSEEGELMLRRPLRSGSELPDWAERGGGRIQLIPLPEYNHGVGMER